ncbi:hypothetical protein BV22DRAFT_772078 [Leucogyrophana mollusca]|uniref:Uncharacterized protein n=1 Tax=Leucogyrophana mollusca TaxID=85980 RepID=A0ACB8B6E8_9AGAM|nr:hypothetical protein BV22DRAFT_772078 [Leucogyrophana mollusca]
MTADGWARENEYVRAIEALLSFSTFFSAFMPILWSSEDVTPTTLGVVDIALILAEGVLYGVSVFMFGLTIYLICNKASPTVPANVKVIVIAFLFITLTTVHLVLDFIGLEVGMLMMQAAPGSQSISLSDLNQTCIAFRNFAYVLVNVLGDAVIIFRCYILWQKYWVVILPFIMWCGVAVFGILGAIGAGIPGNQAPRVLVAGNAEVMTVFFALTLGMNTLTTGLTAYRIWAIEHKARSFAHVTLRSSLRPVMHIVIDAGMVYSLAILVILCTESAQQLLWSAWNPIPPIISIMFYMVIIRVKLLPTAPTSGRNLLPTTRVKSVFDTDAQLQVTRNGCSGFGDREPTADPWDQMEPTRFISLSNEIGAES